MSTALQTLTKNLAARFDLASENSQELMDTLKATAFKVRDGVVSDHQMMALMIVAQQYGLNPWVKEVYAYPDKQNGIVPVVSIDGWSRIVNDNPQLDGIEFNYSPETTEHKGKKCHEWIECVITRKDRSKPIVIREYFDEVCRTLNFATPWDTHPKRMHRHKAMIQCARVAFGFGGIYDQDEAERIGETSEKVINPIDEPKEQQKPPEKPIYSDESFQKNKSAWRDMVISGKKSSEAIIKNVETKAVLTEEQKLEIDSWNHEND